MKKKFSFDPAWVIFFMVASTLVVLNFMEDEYMHNLVAGIMLFVVGIVFLGSILMRSLTDRIG